MNINVNIIVNINQTKIARAGYIVQVRSLGSRDATPHFPFSFRAPSHSRFGLGRQCISALQMHGVSTTIFSHPIPDSQKCRCFAFAARLLWATFHMPKKAEGTPDPEVENLDFDDLEDEDGPPAKRRPWGPDEDEHLRQLVDQYGIKSWAQIATNLSNRNGKQCRERWRNHLRPQLNKGEWTTQEDVDIWDHVQTMGTKWAQVC